MGADEGDPPRKSFTISGSHEPTEGKLPTVEPIPSSVYPTHSVVRRLSTNAASDGDSGLFTQHDSSPATEDQSINEVRAIYAGLVMVEKKCIEVDKRQRELKTQLSESQWQALISLHRTLLNEHHDFFLASQHPTKTSALKRLAGKYRISARMWRHGIYSFLELLRRKLPESLEHMLNFIDVAYSMMTLLLESVPSFQETWIECLGDLRRCRIAVEETNMRDRKLFPELARYRYNQDSDRSPGSGRLQHHLAVSARPDVTQQLLHYTTALDCRSILQESRILSEQGFITDEDIKQESQSKIALSSDRKVRIFEIPCQLAGHSTSAVGDYGAKKNFMKEEYALHLGLPVSQNIACKVTIGSGKLVTTVGATSVPFRFSGEDKMHNLEFQLLPNCIHNVIIGKPF